MPINSKRKGAAGEREYAALCREHGFLSARRGQQFSGLEGDDVVGMDGFHVEVKRVQKLNIDKAMEQSIKDTAGQDIPIVAHRKNHKDWLITLKATDFFQLLKGGNNHDHL
jgi:Holliday junction resolvase